MNSALRKSNKSGIRGVGLDKRSGKWKARIGFKGKKIGLGIYDDINDAKDAYEAAAIKYHGEFAKII